MELTVIIPCLNEETTIGACVEQALDCMKENNINGEVLVVDNGSTDNSVDVSQSAGARVVRQHIKGYGSAIRTGIMCAKSKYCIMADADGSYDFGLLVPYLDRLRAGYDLVMGNRFSGGIEQGAMPFLHRYLGTPVISLIGKVFFHSKVGDFNCGMRGFNREKMLALDFQYTGMEFASEMIAKSSLGLCLIAEVPTTLHKDKRNRPPFLNTWADGCRHLYVLTNEKMKAMRGSR